jgi:predicted permease
MRTTAGTQHHRTAAWLVGAEIALAVTLVIGATLLVRSFQSLGSVTPGFQTERVIAARLTPPAVAYGDTAKITALYSTVLERARALPGVEAVAAVDKLPFAQQVWGVAVRVQGQFEDGTRALPDVGHYQQITPEYFRTMGIALQRGRIFTDGDREGQEPVAIVSESVGRKFWPNEDAVGKRIGYAWSSPWLTIVGVVADVKQDGLRDSLATSVFVPWQQRTRMSGSEMWVAARTRDDPARLATALRSIVAQVDRTVPVSDVRTMHAVVDSSLSGARFMTLLVGGFALAAMLLGAIGIYGVMSYLVSLREREIGIRMALGARASQVQRMVLARSAKMAAFGILAGSAVALFATRSLRAMLYEVSATDPITFAIVPLFFLLVALAAGYAPARRSTRLDPLRALRQD